MKILSLYAFDLTLLEWTNTRVVYNIKSRTFKIMEHLKLQSNKPTANYAVKPKQAE